MPRGMLSSQSPNLKSSPLTRPENCRDQTARDVTCAAPFPDRESPRPRRFASIRNQADEMRPAPKLPQLVRLPQELRSRPRKRKEEQADLSRAAPSPRKIHGHRPGKPAPPRFLPPAQPADESERGERNIERFDLDHPAFFEQAEIRQPHERGGERAVRPECVAGRARRRRARPRARRAPMAVARSIRCARRRF